MRPERRPRGRDWSGATSTRSPSPDQSWHQSDKSKASQHRPFIPATPPPKSFRLWHAYFSWLFHKTFDRTIFTDGLIEAVNDADQEFEESRLLEVLKSSDAAGARATLKNLLSAVDAFVGHTRQHDDITCLLLRID